MDCGDLIQKAALSSLACLLAAALPSPAQVLSPPIAEYRKKADGMLTLTNVGDAPLATILELRAFSVDDDGNLQYGPPDPQVSVRLGSNSFTIPPRQVHYVFYKASCLRLPCWFAIINTLTQATPVASGMRVNIILPHLVYIYQKPKFRKGDVHVQVLPGRGAGQYRLSFENHSQKLERVETVQLRGFTLSESYGGFPLFPGQTRWLSVETGTPSRKAQFRIRFAGGLRLDVPLPEEAESTPR